MPAYQSDEFRKQRRVSIEVVRRPSGMARVAFACAIMFFIPGAPALALLLGVFAWWAVGRNPALSGRGHALAAIALGLLFAVVQTFVGVRGAQYWEASRDAPHRALAAGFDGDVDGFLAHFDDPRADEAAARTFLDLVERRYGRFVRCEAVRDGGLPPLPSKPDTYTLHFEDGSVQAHAARGLDTAIAATFLESHLAYLRIVDPTAGDLQFPNDGTVRIAGRP